MSTTPVTTTSPAPQPTVISLLDRAIVNWRSTLFGLTVAAIAVTKAVQESGHNPYTIIIAVAAALQGIVSTDH